MAAPMRRIMDQHHMTGDPDLAGTVGDAKELRASHVLAWTALVYLLACVTITSVVLFLQHHRNVKMWARFLGLAGTIFAIAQYLPQLIHTARARLVQSLSIPMMCLQVPGSVLFIYTLASHPGAHWTSLLAYIVTGVMQAALLLMCCVWKVRQSRSGVDDWGRPLPLLAA